MRYRNHAVIGLHLPDDRGQLSPSIPRHRVASARHGRRPSRRRAARAPRSAPAASGWFRQRSTPGPVRRGATRRRATEGPGRKAYHLGLRSRRPNAVGHRRGDLARVPEQALVHHGDAHEAQPPRRGSSTPRRRRPEALVTRLRKVWAASSRPASSARCVSTGRVSRSQRLPVVCPRPSRPAAGRDRPPGKPVADTSWQRSPRSSTSSTHSAYARRSTLRTGRSGLANARRCQAPVTSRQRSDEGRKSLSQRGVMTLTTAGRHLARPGVVVWIGHPSRPQLTALPGRSAGC